MKYLSYILIIFGSVVAIYAKTGVEQNQYFLIGGLVILMVGIYRISRNIPGKHNKEDDMDTNEKF